MGRRTLLLIASILVAALGTALIWLYVQGADTRAVAGENQVPVYVAARSVAAGDAVAPDVGVLKPFPQSVVSGLGRTVVTSASQIRGFAKSDIAPGLPLLTSQFVDAQAAPAPAVALGRTEVAMQVTLPDPQRLAGLLQPGSRIRVYAQMKETKGTGVGVLFQNVRVLISGPVTDTTSNAKSNVPQAIVTLALTNEQAKALVLSQAAGGGGTLWFGLLPTADVDKDNGHLVDSVRPGGQG